MKLNEVISADDKSKVMAIKAKRRKKNNPKPSKTTKLNSFIDVFGGMSGYDSPEQKGTVNPSTNP